MKKLPRNKRILFIASGILLFSIIMMIAILPGILSNNSPDANPKAAGIAVFMWRQLKEQSLSRVSVAVLPFGYQSDEKEFSNEVSIAFRDIDDSFSFNSYTRLIIKLGDLHPDHLLIFSPEGYVYYFLNTTEAGDEVTFKNELLIDPTEFKGIRYDEDTGEQIEENVFKLPGKYILYFANNTETEPENTFSLEKSIRFE